MSISEVLAVILSKALSLTMVFVVLRFVFPFDLILEDSSFLLDSSESGSSSNVGCKSCKFIFSCALRLAKLKKFHKSSRHFYTKSLI